MNLREAAELAMWTLESTGTDPCDPKQAIQYNRELRTIERLRQALAQQKKEWVGLTDAQVEEIAEYHGIDGLYETSRIDFYRAIEIALKEKNT